MPDNRAPITPGEEPAWETGEITVRHDRETFVITHAPDRALVSLQVLMANPQAIRIVDDLMFLGEPDEVAYRVVELIRNPLALRVERWDG